jgi:hypothetical protein
MENPFIIELEEKEEYNIEDYIKIQEKLSQKNIDNILKSYFPPKNCFYDYNDFKNRCSRGITQNIIDLSNNIFPTKNLYKIGNGGNNKNCIVCCTPINHKRETDYQYNSRYNASQSIKQSLENTGYNGYFYLFNGGFPNPTGKEMKYLGVPYCFKIFMMLEAKKKGFERIIWLDSACMAINNPNELFERLEHDNVLFRYYSSNNNYDAMVFKETIELLNGVTNSDIHSAGYLMTIVFGLNLESESINKVIEEYYHMVELGLPFLSIFPEEIVLSAIFNKPEYRDLILRQKADLNKLFVGEKNKHIVEATNEGYYFYHRDNKNFM